MNRIYQIYKTYEPEMSDYKASPFYDFVVSNHGAEVELIGSYNDCMKSRGYVLECRRVVAITTKVVEEEEKLFNFANSHDVPVGNKIEIDGEDYLVTDKKYQLNGVIDYYVQDKFIKCENYKKQYEKVKGDARAYLLSKRELENKIKDIEENTEKKKSIWWYFGIR